MSLRYTAVSVMTLIVFTISLYWISERVLSERKSESESDESAEKGNTWYENWSAGWSAAKKEKKPILVDFYSDNCGPCVAMHKTTFAAGEIIDRLAKDWISIRINTDYRDKSGIYDDRIMNYTELAQYFRIHAVPTFLFFDKKGELVQKAAGYRKKEQFSLILDYMKDEVYKEGITFKEFKKTKEDSRN